MMREEVLLLGCGDVGYFVADELKKRGESPAIVDRDERKVETLRHLGHRAFLGDFGSPETLKKAGIGRARAVLVLASDFSEVKRALSAISQVKDQLGVNPPVLARIPDEAAEPEAMGLCLCYARPTTLIVAADMLKELDRVMRPPAPLSARELLERILQELRKLREAVARVDKTNQR